MYLNPTLPDEILDSIYERYHRTDDVAGMLDMVSTWVNDPDGPYQLTLSHPDIGPHLDGARVLEVGCGPGRFLKECRLRGANVLGVDPSPGAVEAAREHMLVEVLLSSFEAAMEGGLIQSGSYDFVFLFEVIEHVRAPETFLRLLLSCLKPGGRFVLSTPNFQLFFSMGDAATVVATFQEHLHFFTAKTLRAVLIKAGFEDAEVHAVGHLSQTDRMKSRLSHRTAIRTVWRLVRSVPLVLVLKDKLFQRVAAATAHEEGPLDTGTDLVALARRPALE
jgi:2-polyprenyl-3-methyl-5-hydroxy-6-metoxy-1,4-benzoquinol methylase